jgi:hypothetical protein
MKVITLSTWLELIGAELACLFSVLCNVRPSVNFSYKINSAVHVHKHLNTLAQLIRFKLLKTLHCVILHCTTKQFIKNMYYNTVFFKYYML